MNSITVLPQHKFYQLLIPWLEKKLQTFTYDLSLILTSTSWGTSASWCPCYWPTPSTCQSKYSCTVYRHGKISLQIQKREGRSGGRGQTAGSQLAYSICSVFGSVTKKVLYAPCKKSQSTDELAWGHLTIFLVLLLETWWNDMYSYLFFLCKRHKC